MTSRIPTLALLMLLVACGTTQQPAVRGDAEYLEGVTSRYSIRLDELQPSGDHENSKLPGAVVAGDDELVLTGSMMRQEPYLALDLVIQNRGELPIVVQRSNIHLRDNLGNRLAAVADFPGAENLGLRADTASRIAYGINVHRNQAPPARSASREPRAKTVAPDQRVASQLSAGTNDLAWLTEVGSDLTVSAIPDVLHLAPGDHRAYWAYWMAEEVEYPLFVMAHIGDKSLMLKFDAPPIP